MTCSYTGAYVHVQEYGIYAPADLYDVAGATVVRFNGDPRNWQKSFEPMEGRTITHEVTVQSSQAFIRFDLGMIVVPSKDVIGERR